MLLPSAIGCIRVYHGTSEDQCSKARASAPVGREDGEKRRPEDLSRLGAPPPPPTSTTNVQEAVRRTHGAFRKRYVCTYVCKYM